MHEIASCLDRLKNGDDVAAAQLWQECYERLVTHAKRRLGNSPLRDADEEDIAQSAFKSFCLGAEAGAFPQLADEDDLWKVLFSVTSRKVSAYHRRRSAKKRGGGEVRGESVFHGDENAQRGMEQIAAEAPTPETIALIGESVANLLDALPDEKLRKVALLKLDGYTNEEIAEAFGCVVRSIERKLKRIRAIWSPPDDLAD